jgi:hypothetical protein
MARRGDVADAAQLDASSSTSRSFRVASDGAT